MLHYCRSLEGKGIDGVGGNKKKSYKACTLLLPLKASKDSGLLSTSENDLNRRVCVISNSKHQLNKNI